MKRSIVFILLLAVFVSACGVDTTGANLSTVISYSDDGVQADLARWKKSNRDCWIIMWEKQLAGIRIVYDCNE